MADSRGDNLTDWVTKGLPEPKIENGIIHYREDSFPSGRRQETFTAPYDLRFAMASGEEIRYPDNGLARSTKGLFTGQQGQIVVRPMVAGARFEAGQRFHIVFYYFRPQRDEMDLNALLRFALIEPHDLPFDVEVKSDFNPYKSYDTGKADTILVKVRTAVSEIRIPHTVLPAALDAYKDDHNGASTHGRFAMILFLTAAKPKRSDEQYDAYVDGAWLRG